MSVEETAARAGIETAELEEIERTGTQRLSYEQITSLVRATQPERPSWWDQGHEHDLSLLDAHLPPWSGAEANYWARIRNVREVIALRRSQKRERSLPA